MNKVEIPWREFISAEEFLSDEDMHVYSKMRILKTDNEEVRNLKMRYRELHKEVIERIRRGETSYDECFSQLNALVPTGGGIYFG